MGLSKSGMPYPEPGASVDVPRDIKALAQAIDGTIKYCANTLDSGQVLGTANANLASTSIPAGPDYLIIEWSLQVVNLSSASNREAFVNVYVDGAFVGNGQRQRSLRPSEWADMSGQAKATGLSTSAAHTVAIQARASAGSTVSMSYLNYTVTARK